MIVGFKMNRSVTMSTRRADESRSSGSTVALVTQCCVSLRERLAGLHLQDLLKNPFRRWDNESTSHCEDNVCYAFSNFLGKIPLLSAIHSPTSCVRFS